MMRIHCLLRGHRYENEIQTVTQLFFPNGKYILLDDVSPEGITVVSEIKSGQCHSGLYMDGVLAAAHHMALDSDIAATCDRFQNKSENESNYQSENKLEKEQKRIVKLCMFAVLKEKTGIHPPWGAMTGIRPSKIARTLLDEGKSRIEATEIIQETYLTSLKKTELCIDVAEVERSLLREHPLTDTSGASLYVGIPFCPTRCLYCSFTSYPLEKFHTLPEPYLQCLVKEMDALRDFFAQKKLTTVYIGGGTPSSLDEKQIDLLLNSLYKILPINEQSEITFEAGRPDTLNRTKLQILKDYKVSRLSINPQSMNGSTLERIGRRHTVDDFIHAYHLARAIGHQNINMDIILGLPGETVEDVAHTMDELAKLAPESVTIHTLAIKRASRLKESLEDYKLAEMDMIESMLGQSRASCARMNLHPYYMYRQKNMLGNFENVGYSAAGKECLYNVVMMEETQSVAAIGAGAVTKIVHAGSNRIERAFNVKNVEVYIKRIDEMIARKNQVWTHL